MNGSWEMINSDEIYGPNVWAASESYNPTFNSHFAGRNPGLNQQYHLQESLPGLNANNFFDSNQQTSFQKIRNKLWPIKKISSERNSVIHKSHEGSSDKKILIGQSAQANNLIINTQFSDGATHDRERRRIALEGLLMKPVVS